MSAPNLPLPYAADLDLLQMATSSLMTRFYAQPCPCVARAVVRHLEEVLRHPRVQSSLAVHEGYAALLEQWRMALERTRETLARQRQANPPAHPRPVVH